MTEYELDHGLSSSVPVCKQYNESIEVLFCKSNMSFVTAKQEHFNLPNILTAVTAEKLHATASAVLVIFHSQKFFI